ncbi:cache domain-containing sensor histidine kinase [Paenibacillus arenilitoris]|nr:sensor histidine kinase [Paenibacillus arenilitoris]
MIRRLSLGNTRDAIANMKLQKKMMLSYLLICMIPLLTAILIIYRQSADSLEQSAEEFAALYTSQIDSSVLNFVHEYDRITKSVLIDNDILSRLGAEDDVPMSELIDNKNSINRLLMRVAVLKPEISGITLISNSHHVYSYTNTSNMVKEDLLLEQEWHKRVPDADDAVFITGLHDQSYFEKQGEGALFTVGRVLYNPDGSRAGILLIDLDPSELLKLNEKFIVARDRYDMRVIIYTNSGEMVYHSDMVSGKTTWKELSAQKLDPATESQEGLIVLTSSTDATKLTVRTEIPRDKLLQKIDTIAYAALLVFAISFIIIIVVSVVFSSNITRPIQNLRKSMKLAEAGQYAPIETTAVNGEIGHLVFSYNKMITTIKSLIEEVYVAEIKQKQAKFLALQHQINPHMLYNTLESIRMKALMRDQEEIADMIKILARMLRLSLGREGDRHLIQHEADYTINYLRLQNLRFNHLFQLHIRLQDEVLQSRIIPLVFQPIVENSIQHGFQDYNKPVNIRIDGEITPEADIRILIADDAGGMEADKAAKLNEQLLEADSDKLKVGIDAEDSAKSIGLKNIAERIKLQYGDRYYLTVHSVQGKGTTIEIVIPKQ